MGDEDSSVELDWNLEAEEDGGEAAPGGGISGSRKPDAVYDVSVDVVAVLGTANLRVSQILKLGRGAVVELDRAVNEPIEIRANNHLVARGEVVVVEDSLAVQLTEVIYSQSDDIE